MLWMGVIMARHRGPSAEEAWANIIRKPGWRVGVFTFPLSKLSTMIATRLQMQLAGEA